MQRVDLAAQERHQRLALQPVRRIDPGDLAEGRVDVEVGDRLVDHLAAGEGAAHDHHHAGTAVGQRRLAAGEGDAVVGGADDQGVVDQAEVVEGVEDGADPLVERAHAGLELGHVAPRRRQVGQVRGRQRVKRVADRGGRREVTVGLEEADRHEPRFVGPFGPAQRLDRQRRDILGLVRLDLDHLVVADHPRVLGDVLLADQDRVVAAAPQRVDPVPAIVVQLPAAVGEPLHAVVVASMPGSS